MRSASELRMSSTCQSSGPLCHPYYYKSGSSLKFREPFQDPKEHVGFAHGQNRWIIACKQPMLLWLLLRLTKPGRPKFFLLIRDVTVTCYILPLRTKWNTAERGKPQEDP